ncbi:MAG: hypothetical protein GIKADHBN_01092 [Phycisphaerales bacterium]|nr:hypothetical protein [Phycisphaerales bacterium]
MSTLVVRAVQADSHRRPATCCDLPRRGHTEPKQIARDHVMITGDRGERDTSMGGSALFADRSLLPAPLLAAAPGGAVGCSGQAERGVAARIGETSLAGVAAFSSARCLSLHTAMNAISAAAQMATQPPPPLPNP